MHIVAFTETFADLPVRFQIMYLSECIYVWVSTSDKLSNLTVATPGRLGASSVLLGLSHGGSQESLSFAQQLCSHTGKVVYASVNMPPDTETLQVAVLRRLMNAVQSGEERATTSSQALPDAVAEVETAVP